MKSELAQEVIQVLPDERTRFRYYPGRYACELLRDVISPLPRKLRSIRRLRSSAVGGLLQKPSLAPVLALCADGYLNDDAFLYSWPDESLEFLLGLTVWGDGQPSRWNQITGSGCNLVLQLNFTTEHLAVLRRYFGDVSDPFNFRGHPVCKINARRFRPTLAWCRIDFDLDTSEALIEEVQSDWVREAMDDFHYFKDDEQVRRYYCEALLPYRKIWSEAMLCAAFTFLRTEIGVERIYYHRFESGCKLKGITRNLPPRSLYTDLPRRFAMIAAETHPEFLMKDKLARRKLRALSKQENRPCFLRLPSNVDIC